jgi:hypothetical protein
MPLGWLDVVRATNLGVCAYFISNGHSLPKGSGVVSP